MARTMVAMAARGATPGGGAVDLAGRRGAQLPANWAAVCMKTTTTEPLAKARQATQPP